MHETLLIPTPDTGLIIAVDGPDGSGKGTQIARLIDHLRARCPGRDVRYIKNPAMEKGPGILRRLLLGQPVAAIKPRTPDTFPTFADGGAVYDPTRDPQERATPIAQRFCIVTESLWTYETEMLPLLRDNAILVCDRSYFISSYIYGIGEGVSYPIMEAVLDLYQRFLRRPDAAFILDVPADVSVARIAARTGQECNAYDASSLETFALRRQLYYAMASRFPWAEMLNGNDTPDAVTANMLVALEDRLGARLRA